MAISTWSARTLALGILILLAAPNDAAACAELGVACGASQAPCCAGLACTDPGLGGTCVIPAGADEPCSAGVPCADGFFCQPDTQRCSALKTVGEACSAGDPCRDGLICEPCFLDACAGPSQCFPDPNAGAITSELCFRLYSPALHQTAVDAGTALTYASGSAVAGEEGELQKFGVVYGPDVRFGCFTTVCVAMESDVSIEPFVSLGSYPTAHDVGGASTATVQDAEIEGVGSFSASEIFARDPDQIEGARLVGTESCIAAGVSPELGRIPMDAGVYVCETAVELVMGNRSPIAMCTDVMACADSIECVAPASISDGSVDPDDDMVGLVQDPAGPFEIGSHSVTLTAVDPYGGEDECTATVTVEDCTPPVITCPVGPTAECQSDGHAVVDPGDAVVRDCSDVTVTDPGSATYEMGTTAVTYTAFDAFENNASCETHVTVVDTTPPTITCPRPTSAECTGNEQARVDPGDATASDCNPVSITDPGSTRYPLGESAVEYVATDSVGLSSSCTAKVTVQDTRPPVITCPADVVTECQGFQRARVNPGDAVAMDTCSNVAVTDPGTGTYPLGVTTVEYTASDTSGNATSCEMTVSVVDTTPPVITCPEPTTAECTGNQQAMIDPGDAAVFDCNPTSVTDPGLESYPLGETAVEYVATDTVGLSSSCETVVTIEDTLPPVITCPPDIRAECQSPRGALVDPDAAIATDVCTDVLVTDPGMDLYPLGTTTVPYQATDMLGNAAACEMAVRVVDTVPPTITSISATPDRLWPPNHEMWTVGVEVVAEDVCDAAVTCRVVSVASDEPADGLGDGSTPIDFEIVDASTVRLRAERSGDGDGRVYTIMAECTDATGGNAARATTRVIVRHDQGQSS